jgi:hypothetical protein
MALFANTRSLYTFHPLDLHPKVISTLENASLNSRNKSSEKIVHKELFKSPLVQNDNDADLLDSDFST